MKLITAACVFGAILNFMTPMASAAGAALGEPLSISVTNKYGDVFTNLVVAKILGDGLVLEHKAGQLKVKYADLPLEIREKYQPLAVAAEEKAKKEAAANAAFVAAQRRTQAEQTRQRAMPAREQPRQQPVIGGKLRIEIPKQGWGITVLNLGLRELGKQSGDNQFAYQAMSQNGFNLSIFVEPPSGGSANIEVFNFYWPRASANPLIDEKSIKAETKGKFVKVTYTALNFPNVNYYFAFKGKWVDVHLSKAPFAKGDEKLFADFEEALTYGD
jgi:hypothetical protein